VYWSPFSGLSWRVTRAAHGRHGAIIDGEVIVPTAEDGRTSMRDEATAHILFHATENAARPPLRLSSTSNVGRLAHRHSA
jgi:hypothetical protein